MQDWPAIVARLRDEGLRPIPRRTPRPVAGGDVSQAFRVETEHGALFLKIANVESLPMLEAEGEALDELDRACAVRVPRPLACVCTGSCSLLAIEWLDLSPPDAGANGRFGRELADLHRRTRERHGWHRDNTIGATPQANAPDDDWIRFFRLRRLKPQFDLAASNGHGGRLDAGARWLDRNVGRLFDGYEPEPSLLHGDLWGGNWAAVAGRPVMFDPALYYGDRESDIAMTRLFGGFSADFYRAYEACLPLAPGSAARSDLYQLYHVLNHLNLFGAAYLGQAQRLIDRLRRAVN